MAKIVVYEYEVTGIGTFPTDMLRYDQAWPAREQDAVLLTAPSRFTPRTFRIKSHSAPKIDRWESFGWKVSNQKEWKY